MMMSLQRWLGERRLRLHRSSAEEIKALWEIVARDLKDAIVEQLSLDRRYASAYNAILQLATIVLRASGYRTAGEAHHWLTFQALSLLMRSLDPADASAMRSTTMLQGRHRALKLKRFMKRRLSSEMKCFPGLERNIPN
jgi:hypothetical protein